MSPARIEVTGAPIEQIGDIAGRAAITLHELSAQAGSLEEAFIQLTGDSVEYGTSRAPAGNALAPNAPPPNSLPPHGPPPNALPPNAPPPGGYQQAANQEGWNQR